MQENNDFSTSELIYNFIKDKQKRTQFHCNQSEVSINDNGNFGICIKPEPVVLSSKKIQIDNIFLLIFYFDIIDDIVNKIFPEYSNSKFSEKYKNIVKNDNAYYKLIAETYRVLLIFRNCYAHHRHTIRADSTFSYRHRGKEYGIVFDDVLKDAVKCLSEYIYSISKTNNKFHKSYAFGVYKKLLAEGDFSIKDQFGSRLKNIPFDFTFSTRQRNVYKVESCSVVEDIIYFQIDSMRFQKLEERNEQESYDLLILHEGNSYLIPKEILNGQPQMSYQEFLTWKYIEPEENL